jgi:hypothetical protein
VEVIEHQGCLAGDFDFETWFYAAIAESDSDAWSCRDADPLAGFQRKSTSAVACLGVGI